MSASAKEQMIELRKLLGEAGFVDGVWQMRINASQPVPRQFTRQWAWSREKVVSLRAYRRREQSDLERAGNGTGLR